MKKTIFTFSAIAIVCGAIFFACKKDDNSAIHTTYVSQSSGGTGTNPDPNHTNTTSGVTTAGTTTSGTTTTSGSTTSTTSSTTPTSTTTTHFSVDGTAATPSTPLATVNGSTYVVVCYDVNGSPSVQVTFNGTSAPATGIYPITNGTPTSTQCSFLVNTAAGTSTASSQLVTVTAGSPNTVTFNNISCTGTGGPHTVTGTIKY